VVRQESWDTSSDELTVFLSALVAAWAIGSGTRSRRAHLDELRARARELERDRDLQAAFAVAAERGRISRELHDVVAHGLSVMVIQAQGGAAALDNRPADTRSALDAIVRTGRESLADMRRVLAAVGAVDDTWHPQPGLGQLTALVAQVRKAGTPVAVRVEGATAPLPSTVDLSAYRIVQEALTNTMKHAGRGAKAEVVLSYAEEEIGIRVGDDGRGATGGSGGGNGLRGMRERVRLLGGSLVTGPGPAGGFVVRAALPIRGSGS
jgi:signal transduction histidine kinase